MLRNDTRSKVRGKLGCRSHGGGNAAHGAPSSTWQAALRHIRSGWARGAVVTRGISTDAVRTAPCAPPSPTPARGQVSSARFEQNSTLQRPEGGRRGPSCRPGGNTEQIHAEVK